MALEVVYVHHHDTIYFSRTTVLPLPGLNAVVQHDPKSCFVLIVILR